MFVSMEAITTIACAVSVVGSITGLGGWFIRRVDARFDKVDARFDRLEDRVSGVEHELTEVKIAVARLEGPPPRLATAR
ncbi:hypothetical protein [Microbacterium sp. SA39]|uniref:hypothetical protein n=1 Tax=Microbacterium sp. SA39 TaxID=1263625 RepID=UPI0005FA6FF1|nr:hypothetical protein [Microbacterium sp. SA39]KJQ52474.1 hypothetical protein RS85_03364 [Microbacterium sp. SA39]